MPLPTAAELTDPNATNTQMKQRLGQLAENAISKDEAKGYVDALFSDAGLIEVSAVVSTDDLIFAGYLSNSNGEFVESENWRCTDFIPIKAGETAEVQAITNSNINANIIFYDSNKQKLKIAYVSPIDSVGVKDAIADNAGFVRFATRIASSAVFNAKVVYKESFIPVSKIDSDVASFDYVKNVAEKKPYYFKNTMRSVGSSTLGFYIDNNGNAVASASRMFRKIRVDAGETVFYKGFTVAHPTIIEGINGALFVPDSNIGSSIIVSAAPTTASSVSTPDFWFSGEFTAQESGTFYINLKTTAYLGVVIQTSEFELKVGKLTLDYFETYKVDNQAQHQRERLKNASVSNGQFALLESDLYYVDDNQILFLNGSKQTTQYTPSTAQQSIYVAVMKGDEIEYTGYLPSNSNSQLDHIIQCDVHKKPVASLYTQPISSGVKTIKVTALQDGYIAIRQVNEINENYSASSVYYKSKSSDLSVSNSKTPLNIIEKLPKRLSMDHGYNSQTYSQNNIIEAGGYQYVVGVDELRKPFILKRDLLGGPWSVYDLSTISGNPFASPNDQDSHNNFVVCVTKDGYIIVTGNHHGHSCRCVISTSPHDITAWTQIKYSLSSVTYPRLIRNGDTTLAFWREGGSGDGTYYMAEFDDATRTFNAKRLLVNQAEAIVGKSNPYEQMIAIDQFGAIHLCWGYRTSGGSAVANFGMFYAKSVDNGLTWTNADNSQTYALPLTDLNSERIYAVQLNQGYVNQNGGCYDLMGNYHTVFWHSDPDNGFSRIIHVWFDGAVWKNQVVHRLGRLYPPSSNMLPGLYTRPHVICGQAGRIFVVFKNNYDDVNKIFMIDVTDESNHIKYDAINFGTRQTELALNIEFPIKNNELVMMLAKGGGNVTNDIWKNQSAYLVTVPLPLV